MRYNQTRIPPLRFIDLPIERKSRFCASKVRISPSRIFRRFNCSSRFSIAVTDPVRVILLIRTLTYVNETMTEIIRPSCRQSCAWYSTFLVRIISIESKSVIQTYPCIIFQVPGVSPRFQEQNLRTFRTKFTNISEHLTPLTRRSIVQENVTKIYKYFSRYRIRYRTFPRDRYSIYFSYRPISDQS